jgi:hypothetical protein
VETARTSEITAKVAALYTKCNILYKYAVSDTLRYKTKEHLKAARKLLTYLVICVMELTNEAQLGIWDLA